MALAIEEALVNDRGDRCASVKALRELWVGQDKHVEPAVFDLAAFSREPTPLPPSVAGDTAVPESALSTLEPGPARGDARSTLEPGAVRGDALSTLPPETAAALGRAQRRMTLIGVAAGVVGVVAVAAIGLGVWQSNTRSEPAGASMTADEVRQIMQDERGGEAGPTTLAPAPEPEPVDEPAVAELPSASPADDPPKGTAAVTGTVVKSTAVKTTAVKTTAKTVKPTVEPTVTRPRPPDPPAEPAPAPLPDFTWTAKQDGKASVGMMLQPFDGGTRYPPGKVPGGDYRLMVRWTPTGAWTAYPGVTVSGPTTLSCNGLTYKCSPQ
jgi:hypothetical protein